MNIFFNYYFELLIKFNLFSYSGQLISNMMKEENTTITRTVCPTASSATRELDDLMASLSDFKVNICIQNIFYFWFNL